MSGAGHQSQQGNYIYLLKHINDLIPILEFYYLYTSYSVIADVKK